MSACADVGKFHFTSSKARYFTMCGSTLFHVLRKQNISLYAFVSTNAVLVKKKGRGIFAILRPFPVSSSILLYGRHPSRSAFFVAVLAGFHRDVIWAAGMGFGSVQEEFLYPLCQASKRGSICRPSKANSTACGIFSKSQTSELGFCRGSSCRRGTKKTFFLP